MAKIVREVENVHFLGASDYIIEIEHIEFMDQKGNMKKAKMTGLVPISVEKCRQIEPAIDWDEDNFRFFIEIKEQQ